MNNTTTELDFHPDETIQPLPDHVKEALAGGWADPTKALKLEDANDLLEPLDRRRFGLPDGGKIEGAQDIKILTIITTNGERDLPQAFLRRCATLELPEPGEAELVNIARQHFPKGDANRIKAIAGKIVGFRKEAENLRRRPPGTGEFLDAIQACEDLRIQVSDGKDSVWEKIENAILTKTAQLR